MNFYQMNLECEMENNEKQSDTGSQPKIVSEIVGYLKNYPFLLISVAGLVVFIGALPLLEGEKLNAFMPLIYIFLLAPILFQFYLVNKTSSERKALESSGRSGRKAVAAEAHAQTESRHFSRKAIFSLVLIVVNILGYGDLLDKNAHLGAIIALGIPALMLGFSALNDAQHGTVTGKGWAIAATVLSIFMILASLGELSADEQTTPVLTPPPVPSAPFTPDKQVVTPPPQTNFQPTQASQPAVAGVCVTEFGTCPMMVQIPVGSSCTCSGQFGVFPGLAQ